MAIDPPGEVTADDPGPGDIKPRGPSRPPDPSRPKRTSTIADATNRHIDDLCEQRTRLQDQLAGKEAQVAAQSARIIALTATNAQLAESTRALKQDLESERLERGLIGIVATSMAAVGGGFVSIYSDWRRWAFGSLLFVGCGFLFYNSLMNLSSEVRKFGIWGSIRRTWLGPRARPASGVEGFGR